MQNTYARLSRFLVPLVLAFGLSCSLGFQVEQLSSKHNAATFLAMEHGVEGVRGMPPAWRKRLLSNWSASWIIDYDVLDGQEVVLPATIARAQRNWAFGWFLASALCLIWTFKEKSIMFLLGTYAGLSYGYMPGITERFYPWDMPILFFATLFSVAIHRRRFGFLFLIPLAMGFKETAIMFLPGFLLWSEVSWVKRGLAALGVIGLSSLVLVLMTLYSGPQGNFVAEAANLSGPLFASNFPRLLEFGRVHFVLFNAGLLCAFLLVAPRTRLDWVFRLICALFILGAFWRGIISEVRIWFELIPVSLLGLFAFSRRWDSSSPPPRVPLKALD